MKIGSVVMFTDGDATVRCMKHTTLRSAHPEFYPPARTIGTVISFGESGFTDLELIKVQWPSGTTSGNDSWLCYSSCLLEL